MSQGMEGLIFIKLDDTSTVQGNVLVLGNELPNNDPLNQNKNFPLLVGDEILKGDIFSFSDSYYMSLNDIGTIDGNNPLHLIFSLFKFRKEGTKLIYQNRC